MGSWKRIQWNRGETEVLCLGCGDYMTVAFGKIRKTAAH